jgi:Type IV secretory system Conjugative DNA transfer
VYECRAAAVAATGRPGSPRGEDLIGGERPVSVYLTVAPSDLDRMRPLLRIVLNQITRQLTREVRPGRRPVLLMLDELTALGKLDFMHREIGFFRGYGIRAFLSIQSLEQLFQIYGQHQSIGANCGVQVAYGANDVATADPKRHSTECGAERGIVVRAPGAPSLGEEVEDRRRSISFTASGAVDPQRGSPGQGVARLSAPGPAPDRTPRMSAASTFIFPP